MLSLLIYPFPQGSVKWINECELFHFFEVASKTRGPDAVDVDFLSLCPCQL